MVWCPGFCKPQQTGHLKGLLASFADDIGNRLGEHLCILGITQVSHIMLPPQPLWSSATSSSLNLSPSVHAVGDSGHFCEWWGYWQHSAQLASDLDWELAYTVLLSCVTAEHWIMAGKLMESEEESEAERGRTSRDDVESMAQKDKDQTWMYKVRFLNSYLVSKMNCDSFSMIFRGSEQFPLESMATRGSSTEQSFNWYEPYKTGSQNEARWFSRPFYLLYVIGIPTIPSGLKETVHNYTCKQTINSHAVNFISLIVFLLCSANMYP